MHVLTDIMHTTDVLVF